MDFIICLTDGKSHKKARIYSEEIQAATHEIILGYLENAAPQVNAIMIKR